MAHGSLLSCLELVKNEAAINCTITTVAQTREAERCLLFFFFLNVQLQPRALAVSVAVAAAADIFTLMYQNKLCFIETYIEIKE